VPDESTNPPWPNPRPRGAASGRPYDATFRLPKETNATTFPTVFGANVTANVSMTGVGDPLVGQLVDGRYHVTTRLARGGMATVYAAVDTRLTRTVALKVMHVGLGDDTEFARKFDREARAAARLSHPHVVSVFDQGTDGGRPYIVMEYVDGYTLRDVLNAEAPVPPLRALDLLEPVLSALACAHDAGLVHRDIKPENVLISHRGQIKVADFGLAKAISSQTSTATQGLLIGTVSYLPPELVLSGRADARSDVYSAGVVLFELLTGRKPHTGETPIQVAYAHVHNDVPLPSTFRTAGPIPPYLDALVGRATARDAALRPYDARVFDAQARRVQAALRHGLADDPELTADLRAKPTPTAPPPSAGSFTGPSLGPSFGPSPAPSPQSWPPPTEYRQPSPQSASSPSSAGGYPSSDRADHEITQLVPPSAAAGYVGGSRTSGSPRTVRDAAPPGPPQAQLRQLSAERLHAQREREARRRRRGWLVLLLVLMLTTAAALTGWYFTEGRFTSAPVLATLPQAEAEALAQREGLRLDLSSAYSETAAKGTIISTDPAAGTKILDGGTLAAVVSKGPERFTAPTLVGLPKGRALAALRAASLTVGSVREVYDEKVKAGVVMSASARPGELLRRNSSIDLSASRGPKPISIENFDGQPVEAAQAALEKAGFSVKVTTAHSDSVPAGRVISQRPDDGTGFRGDVITLRRSLGPVLVSIPPLQGKSVAEARSLLRERGLKAKVQPVAINYIGAGLVVTTRPTPGRQAPKGSTVTVLVV
jgi:eukaryotic-like serine/threonine-protein kinase